MKRLATALLALAATTVGASESSRWQTDERVLSCKPSVLRQGESIHLRLGSNHGTELSVAREHDKTTFLLVVGGAPEGYSTLMDTQKFAEAKSLELPTTLEATPWEPPFNQAKVRVFDKPGIYWLYVSVNLESEAGGHRCKVKVLRGQK